MKRIAFLFVCFLVPSFVAAQQNQSTKYALLIGVNDYVQMPPLNYAKRDIEELRNRLLSIGFEKENVFTLTCGGATKDLPLKEHIEVALQTVFGLAKKGDVVIIAFTGHGIEIAGHPHFCPPNTREDNPIGTTISINEVFDKFSKCEATFKLMLVDACRDNPFSGRNPSNASKMQTLDDPPKGIILLQSCSKGEISWEDRKLQHGVFTHFLIEGLDGKAADRDGKVTVLGLFKYVNEQTLRHVYDEFRAYQRPYMRGEISDFVLVGGNNEEPYQSPYENIFEAAEKGTVEDMKYFIERKGIDVNVKNIDGYVPDLPSDMKGNLTDGEIEGWTPLIFAAFNPNVEVVKYLVENGGDANNGAFIIALVYGNLEVLKYLLPPQVVNNNEFETLFLLGIAASVPDLEVWKYLVEQVDGIKTVLKDHSKSILPLAAGNNPNLDVLKYLIEQIGDVETVLKDHGASLLAFVTSNPNPKVWEYLIAQGVNVNAIDSYHNTPLHLIFQCNSCRVSVENIQFLIDQGANVNARNKRQETPLFIAAGGNLHLSDFTLVIPANVEIIKCLIENGVDVNAKNSDGKTPLDLATDPEIISYLKSNGARSGKEVDGKTVSLYTLDNPPKGIVVFQSCSRGEVCYEDSDLGLGVFMHYIIEGLGGKAVDDSRQAVTLTSLVSYVTEQTRQHVFNKFQRIQQPYFKGEVTDFVLVPKSPTVKSPGRKYALLVGINGYVELPKLMYPRNDVEALRDQLLKIGFEIVCLTEPTKERIEAALKTVFDLAKEGDVVILAMSGQGLEVSGQPRFCPIDTKKGDIIETTIGINDVLEKFSKCKASFILMLIDAGSSNPQENER